MLKERHRNGVRAAGSRGGAPHRSNVLAPPEVGIIPGNRFLLLPLRKVSALVRHHEHHCRGASATSTKTCIESKPLPTHRPTMTLPTNTVPHTNIKTYRASTNRLMVRQRRRQLAIAKTLLGPISEQEEVTKPLLEDPGNKPWNQAASHTARLQKRQNLERAENARRINTHHYFLKAGRQEDSSRRCTHQSAPTYVDVPTRLASTTSITIKDCSHNPRRSANGTSVFSLDQPLEDLMQKRGTGEVSNTRLSVESESVVESEPEGVVGGKGMKKVRSVVAFGRNRVSPSDHQILGLPSEVFLENSFGEGSVRDRLEGLDPEVSRRFRDSRGEASSFGGCSDMKPTRRSTSRRLFLCSLAKEDDLPIGPVRRVSLKEHLRK